MNLRVVSTICYFAGSGIVILQWLGIVPFVVRLARWIIGLAGWGLSFLPAVRGNGSPTKLHGWTHSVSTD